MIPLFKVFMAEEIDKPLLDVLHSGYIGQGPKVEEFEKMLKEYFGTDYLVTLNSGTSGLHLALHLIKYQYGGLGCGNEVLASPLTCFASNAPILANNFDIKWVDVDVQTLNMNLDDLARKITENTQAIMLPYWGGCSVDMYELEAVLKDAHEKLGVRPIVIEDCAHAMGSEFGGKKIGTFGHYSMFSLQAIKHVTSVDGGILILPNQKEYQRAKLMRWYGIDRETSRTDFRCEADIVEWGFKFHMNDVCATIGIENFRHLNNIVARHRDNAKFYDKNLLLSNGVDILDLPHQANSSYWLYTILVERRIDFMHKMNSCGIQVSRVHERNDLYTCTKDYHSLLPNLEFIIDRMCCIPVGWWVADEDRQYIVDKINEGW